MKLHLTELQIFKLQIALRESSSVLREINLKRIKGEALTDRKLIEQSVRQLEAVLVGK